MSGRRLATYALLSAALAWSLFFEGGVEPTDRIIASIMIATAALLLPAGSSHGRARKGGGSGVRLVGYSLLAYLFAQLIPLPPAMIHFISPTRAKLSAASAPIFAAREWITLTASPSRTILELLALFD